MTKVGRGDYHIRESRVQLSLGCTLSSYKDNLPFFPLGLHFRIKSATFQAKSIYPSDKFIKINNNKKNVEIKIILGGT